MTLRSSEPKSYERVAHDTGLGAFVLPLRRATAELREALLPPRLARCVGPVYCAERETATHWLYVSLPAAFDEWLFFDRSSAVEPLEAQPVVADPDGTPRECWIA
jgi:erythromycin esterase-like protein